MPRVIEAFSQFLDGEGDPLVDGKLKFTVSGTNATDKNTYANITETIANTNPLILDSEGRAGNVFGTGSYRVTVYTSDDVQISQKDPVPGGTAASASFSEWAGSISYVLASIVELSGKYYRSLQTPNIGNSPLTSLDYWEEIKFVLVYNVNRAYVAKDVMQFTDGSNYICTVATSVGETPVTNPEKWVPASNLIYNVGEKINALGTLIGGTDDIDLTYGGVISATISTSEQTFTFSNPPATGINGKFEMYITNGGSQTINWPAGVQWVAGIVPTLTTAGLDVIIFTTNDAGTTWYGFVNFDVKASA